MSNVGDTYFLNKKNNNYHFQIPFLSPTFLFDKINVCYITLYDLISKISVGNNVQKRMLLILF